MLKATVSTLLTGLYAVYKGESNALASLTTNLYAVYKAESNANDSLATYNGTAVGGLTYSAGKSGNAFTLNGTTGYVSLPDNSFNFTGDFSISIWINPTSVSGFSGLLGNQIGVTVSSFYGYFCYFNAGYIYFDIYNGVSGNPTARWRTTSTISTSTWTHLTIVKKPNQAIKYYINGTLDTAVLTFGGNGGAVVYHTTNLATFGANRYGLGTDGFYNGKMDEVNVWNKELTSTEVTELYNSGNGKFYQGNAFYSTIVNDSLGTYNGTAQGGLTYTAGKSGNAFILNGTDAYVDLGDNIFNSFTSDFSISVWVNLNSVSGNQCILNNLSYNASGFSNGWIFLMRNQIPSFEIYTDSGAYQPIGSPTILSTSTWYNIVVTRKSSTRSRIYVNGSLVVADTSSLNPTYVTTLIPIPSTIGTWKYNAVNKQWYLNGKIDELNTWNKELTATEVTDLYNAGSGKFYPY
jgi:hypothetical protein